MKAILFFSFTLIFCSSCQKEEPGCYDDIQLSWKGFNKLEGTNVFVPNAVLNIGHPLAFTIDSSEEIDWKGQSIKLYQDDIIYIEVKDLSQFAISNKTIEFPTENFTNSNGDLATGKVSVELEIDFPQSNKTLHVRGNIHYYSCDDLKNMNRSDCRWPDQLIDGYLEFPC